MNHTIHTLSTKPFEHFWTAQISKDKVWASIILLSLIVLFIFVLYFTRKDTDGRLTCMLLVSPVLIGYIITRIYLLGSPIMTDNLLTLRKEDISNSYFRLDWHQIEKIDYQLKKRIGYYHSFEEPFLLISLKNGNASEYLSNIPLLLRWEFFRLRSIKDPKIIPISLKLISRDPFMIFQVAQKFHGAFSFPSAHYAKQNKM